jgi:hypothetical protein
MMKTFCSKEIRIVSVMAAAIGVILVLWPATGRGQRTTRRTTSQPAVAYADPNATELGTQWADYGIILRRNIFSRQRTAPRPRVEPVERPPVPVPNPEAYFLLRGIVREGEAFLAFIEDTQSGEVLRLRPGDSVARGAVKALTLDELEYEMEDKTVTVRMGLDLEGGHGVATAVRTMDLPQLSTPAGPSATMPAGPTRTPSGDEAGILRRLMEQRRQQLGQ